MSHNDLKTSQKWISGTEPELGMGTIVSAEARVITVKFDLVNEVRTYAREEAPLSRVKFTIGDLIKTREGIEIIVEKVGERDGLYIYSGNYNGTNTSVIETELDPNVTFSKPEERLFTHQTDENSWFNLRYITLMQQARLAALPVRGLLNARISLIPHQLYIANDVASRYAPRVLLADEVGLGKTIEAGLIINQQITTGRATRVLIIVPSALTFQWFVEMIRRFSLQFTLLDEARCIQIEADNMPEFNDDVSGLDNPFEAQQLALCSLDLFLNSQVRLHQAASAEWDLIVVDEAHHLNWNNGFPGEDYLAVETLAQKTPGLLLLTATPEQLGRLGHFSRLKLLDPSRYHNFDSFLEEEKNYEEVADLIEEISTDQAIKDETTKNTINQWLGDHAPKTKDALVRSLLDRHGTGRVLFRNVRESVSGFPNRKLKAHQLSAETFPKRKADSWNHKDARNQWLIDLLKELGEKALVICAKAETAIALERYLRDKSTTRSTVFHEGMDLIERDRAANYFSDKEEGAQVLICSEIGSEGRNFQFASQLIMFDLPESPDLIEQRIGRLDRIAQEQDVVIHVPYSLDSEQQLLLRIYDEGLNMFSGPNVAAQLIFDQFQDRDRSRADKLVREIREASTSRLIKLSKGRDRLIELNSHNPLISEELIAQIKNEDGSADLEDYLESSFALFGLESEPLSEHVNSVRPTEGMVRQSPVSAETQGVYRYPELPDEGVSYTYDRATALAREDILFMTWESPLTQQAMELISANINGNCCFIIIEIPSVKTGTLLLESLHIIECTAPSSLGAAQYMPPAVVRSLVTIDGVDLAENVPFQKWENQLQIDRETTNKILTEEEAQVRKLINHANTVARKKFSPMKKQALAEMSSQSTEEIERLRSLAQINPNVRAEEIEFMILRKKQLSAAISESQVRLDAVRLVLVS